MTTNHLRNYNCKDKELPVLCTYVANNLRRDLVFFAAYSPQFDEAFLTAFEAKIEAATNLVSPVIDSGEGKIATRQLYEKMESLVDPINRMSGYVEMVEEITYISATDFGLVALRKAVRLRDPEAVLKHLQIVNGHIDKYKDLLMTKGLDEELIGQFNDVYNRVYEFRKKQYQIKSNRKTIVNNNLELFNDLAADMSDILKIGKILFKFDDPQRLLEYTFSYLKRQVRQIQAAPDKEAKVKEGKA